MSNVLSSDRVKAICDDAMAQAQKTYENLLKAGVPAYRAQMCIDIKKQWCRLVELENYPGKNMEELHLQALDVRKKLLG